MGAIAIVSTSSSSGPMGGSSVLSLHSSVGLGVGGLFVAIALVVALAYFDLLQGADADREIRQHVLGSIVPLLFVFLSIVIYESARITDLI